MRARETGKEFFFSFSDVCPLERRGAGGRRVSALLWLRFSAILVYGVFFTFSRFLLTEGDRGMNTDRVGVVG